MQKDVLDGCPDNGQATGLGGEHVDLIGALPDIAEQTLNGIGGQNVSVHALRKGIKGQEVFFVLDQTSHRFGIALSILRFEGAQLSQGLLFCRLLPDANQFSLNLSSLSSGDGSEDIALFVHQAALARGSGKQFSHRSEQSIVPISDDQIDLGGFSSAQVMQQAEPSLFALLRTHSQSQNLFVHWFAIVLKDYEETQGYC